MPNKLTFLSVDLQNDFAKPGGKHYTAHANVGFIEDTLLPFLRSKDIKIAEIISDYRQPRPGDSDESCVPGTSGYESVIPADSKTASVWIKCMNSPIWVRQGGGDAKAEPGLPYQDTAGFTKWLESEVGEPQDVEAVVLMGLTIDCCVLCTAQELCFRGYKVKILAEAVDVYSGKPEEKQSVLTSPILKNWAEVIDWGTLKQQL